MRRSGVVHFRPPTPPITLAHMRVPPRSRKPSLLEVANTPAASGTTASAAPQTSSSGQARTLTYPPIPAAVAGPSPQIPSKGSLALQLRERARIDGTQYLRKALLDAAARVGRGEPVTVVFDLDNTLFDTRARTLAIARRFDTAQGTGWCDALTLDEVKLDAAATAAALGPPAPPAAWREAFARYWAEEFWTPANLVYDAPMEATLRWAREAQAAGVTVRYLTGRTTPFHEASVTQLRAAGLEVDLTDVVCKPSVDVATAPFKSETLARWAEDTHIAWFLTEGRRDIAHIEANVAAVTTVLLECSFEDEAAHEVRPTTPRLSQVF